MLGGNFKLAAVLFFGWFILDSTSSIIFSSPFEGIYYPAASGAIKSIPGDWTHKPCFGAPLYLCLFASIWIFFVRVEGMHKGLRLAAIVTAFVMAPFWIVSSISADMYQLDVNGYWLASMIYANVSFFTFGLLGHGKAGDLDF